MVAQSGGIFSSFVHGRMYMGAVWGHLLKPFPHINRPQHYRSFMIRCKELIA